MPFRQATQAVAPGTTLAICSDGLVERPGTDIETQIDTLARTLDSALKGVLADQESLDQPPTC
ncbi:SpoIIE family protein phosphatase [Streptomyces sp. NPDC002676]